MADAEKKLDDQIESDLRIYGNAFIHHIDGERIRLDPKDVTYLHRPSEPATYGESNTQETFQTLSQKRQNAFEEMLKHRGQGLPETSLFYIKKYQEIEKQMKEFLESIESIGPYPTAKEQDAPDSEEPSTEENPFKVGGRVMVKMDNLGYFPGEIIEVLTEKDPGGQGHYMYKLDDGTEGRAFKDDIKPDEEAPDAGDHPTETP